jgi:hypothetical protein
VKTHAAGGPCAFFKNHRSRPCLPRRKGAKTPQRVALGEATWRFSHFAHKSTGAEENV